MYYVDNQIDTFLQDQAAFPQNRFEIVSFEIFCGARPQDIFAPTPIATLTTAMILDPPRLFPRGDRVKFR